jgi:hypothetical protein
MATNRELIAEAQALSAELGVDAPTTDRLNNAQLTALVTRLQEQKAVAAAVVDAAADAAAMGAVAADSSAGTSGVSDAGAGASAPAPVKYPYEVAAGRSITSGRGVLKPGAEVRTTDYSKDDLENLVTLGYVLRNT